MTQTIQEALLKAGLISKEKLAKAEAEKKAAQRAQHARPNYQGSQRPQHQQGDQRHQGQQRPQGPHQGQRPPQQQTRPDTGPQNAAPRPSTATAPSAPKTTPRPPQRPSKPYSPPAPPVHKIGDGLSEGKHAHHIRTDCDACGRSSPDVEYYEHKNRSLDKYWLCVKCADTNNILDDFRQTSQSSQSQRGLFQRGYGHTKRR